MKHLIFSCHCVIWAIYEIFWMKNLNWLVDSFDSQKIYAVSPCQHFALLCWYRHSWLCWECALAEICIIITRSAWHCCWFHSNHQSPSPHGFTGSRLPQHQLSWCCWDRTYAQIISWQNGRLGQYKQLPSLFGAIPSSPYSAPEVWVANALTQQVPEMQFYILRFNYKNSTVSFVFMSDL